MALSQPDVELGKALVTWRLALETGYITSPVWVSWAEPRLLAADPVPVWLCDLYLAKEPQAARNAISDALGSGLYEDSLSNARREAARTLDWTGTHLGFLFLRYRRGDFDMCTLLKQAGRKADCANYEVDCSAFYMVLNELDGGGPVIPSDRPFVERLEELFRPYERMVRELLPLLEIGPEAS